MSFWSGYIMGRISSNNNGNGNKDIGVVICFFVVLLCIHSFGFGIYYAIDAVPRMLAYYTNHIDIRHYDFLSCREPNNPWAESAIKKYAACFHYTRTFSWVAFFLKGALLATWFALLLNALAANRRALWIFSLMTTIAIISAWGTCGQHGCAGYYVAELKNWSYWHQRDNSERIMSAIAYGALGSAGFVLLLLLIRYRFGKDRLARFKSKIFKRFT